MKLFFKLALCLVFSTSIGQVTFQGKVTDSLGTPLEMANVIAIDTTSKLMESYAITNKIGEFKLSLKSNRVYNIQASYVGMKTAEFNLTTKSEPIKRDIKLYLDNALDEVQLVYEMPVEVRGDTLVYNADSFKNGTERKLEDILKKLPGIEVNDDGEIEVEGQRVQKVMVDGKDFFDGDSKLASKNIPSNAVDKVQVLKNYGEVGQLRGVQNNQDNYAINIKLKEGKENFWFGDIKAGGGYTEANALYLFQPKLFYYSPNYSINFIGDVNNLGEVAFTRRDYFNFSGGFRMPSRQSGTNIDLGSNNLGFLSLQNNRAADIESQFAAANFSYSPQKTLDLSGFAIYSGNTTQIIENNSVIYTDNDLNIPDEITNNNTLQESQLGMLKLSAKYKPDVNNQLDYDIVAKTSREEQTQDFFSSVVGEIDQIEEINPFSINQNLNYYYTHNEDNIFAFEAQHLIQDEDPFYNAILRNKDSYVTTANGIGLDNLQSNYNVAQEKRVQSNQLDAKLDYWNILNKKSHLNLTVGSILSRQEFNSAIFQFLDDNSQFEPVPINTDLSNINDITYNFTDLYLGVHYKLKSGIFTFTPGFSAHAYSWNNTQFNEKYEDDFYRILPDLNIRVQLKKSERIIFNYRMQTQFTDVTNLAEGLVLNRYNSLYSGNSALDNAFSHNVNLSYFSFNLFNYTNVFGSLNYNKRIDQIRNLTNFESVIRTNSPFNSDFADENFSANGRFQRSFGKLRASLGGNFNYSKFNQFIQGERSVNENYSQTYNVELRTNFRDAPNFEIAYRYSIQDNDQGNRRTKFYTNSPSVSFDALIFKTLTFKTDYAYNNFSDEDGTLNSFEFWNASLSYRKNADSKLEYELKATNLLDTDRQSQSTNSNISVSASEYFIQPRFISFRLIYSL